MNSTSMVAATAAAGMRSSSSSPFTVSQWQELEHQALIFKYLLAGMPVPPDLVIPIQKSFEAISARFFHHPTMGYCSLYGKKMDPEPGRCRRTDGKKWRCSKDAYPDSKYCERHMHRGRNRSRKPVESQAAAAAASQPSSSTVTVTVSNSSTGGAASYQNLPLHAFGNTRGPGAGSNQSQFHLESIPYGIPHKDYRYVHGFKPEVGEHEHSFFSEASGRHDRGLEMDSPADSAWPVLMPSQVSLFPTLKASDNSIMQNDYTQHSFFGNEFGTGSELVKQGEQSLRPFFDEWPKTRGATWSGLHEDERSNQNSFSTTTQLSISIPMASPDFSTTSSRSPHDC